MTTTAWNDVDQYVNARLAPHDRALDAALEACAAAGLPAISVTASQGKLLALLARSIGARRVLEIGTLGGYSTIWLARALQQDGRVVTLELEPKHADIARANIARAGLESVVEVRLGAALDSLAAMIAAREPAFDFTFIDADKANIPEYFQRSLALSRPGAFIVVDNVVRDGGLADASSADPSILGVRRLHEMLANEPRVSATTVQTVGSKGWDGFTLALVGGRS